MKRCSKCKHRAYSYYDDIDYCLGYEMETEEYSEAEECERYEEGRPSWYEDEEYTRCQKGMPNVGQTVKTEFGSGKVVSVDILNRKYKNNITDFKDLDKKMLFSMCEEEFRARYNKLLHFIYEHTSNAEEKIRIGYIFNPPNREEAKRFLNSGGTNIC